MQLSTTIREYFHLHQEEIRSRICILVTEMVKEKTVNVISEKLTEHPYLKFRGEEYRVAELVKRELDKSAIKYEVLALHPGRPNIISHQGLNRNGRRLLMPAHMDIVPAGEGWNTDPYAVIEKNGNLYGRGTLDNKGPLAAILVAAQILRTLEIDAKLNGELQVAALSDEEAEDPDGINYGIGYLVEEKLINPTMAVVPDIGGNMVDIDVAEKGRVVLKIVATGKQAHGSTPEKGINAVYLMARLITEIEKLQFDYELHPVLGKPTLNLGEIQGGVAPNVVPGICQVYIDIRTVPGMTRDKVLSQLQACIAKVGEKHFHIEVISWNEPHAIDPDNVIVRAIQKNAVEVLKIQPQAIGQGGGTYAKTLNLHGITAVGWGPGDDNAFHVANEYVEVKQLVDFALMTCLLAVDLLA